MFIIRRCPVPLCLKIRTSSRAQGYFKLFQYCRYNKFVLVVSMSVAEDEEKTYAKFKCNNSLLLIASENETMDV